MFKSFVRLNAKNVHTDFTPEVFGQRTYCVHCVQKFKTRSNIKTNNRKTFFSVDKCF